MVLIDVLHGKVNPPDHWGILNSGLNFLTRSTEVEPRALQQLSLAFH